MNFTQPLSEVIYLVGTVLFILGMKKLGKVETSKSGNTLSILGMTVGILTMTLIPLKSNIYEQRDIFLILIVVMMFSIGAIIGYVSAVKVKLTSLPEMVSLFNGFGGLCSMFIGLAEGIKVTKSVQSLSPTISASILIGGMTASGSLIAWNKLSGGFFDKIKFPISQSVNAIFLLLNLALVILMSLGETSLFTLSLSSSIYILLITSLIYGVTFVIPIGGGDMPVVISLLNSLSGIAAATAGLIYENTFMITGGILVGASGTFLTVLMCRGMNRSLFNVIIGGFTASGSVGEVGNKTVRETEPFDLAIKLKYSQKVMVVPGYGMAVAQAQHALKELETELVENGVQVFYAIHPVAGRMPGHMNVLLAEAQVSYDIILEMEEANRQLFSADVALVIGANDVVNPDAKENPASSIYGMPILEVEQAQTVVILKRSMKPGYAGIENPLFYRENSQMLFGDAKDSLQKLKTAVKEG